MICTLVVGALAYFIKKTLGSLEDADKKNADDIREEERKREQDIKDLTGQFNDLKSDLTLVYTLREDFIRSMNSGVNLEGLVWRLQVPSERIFVLWHGWMKPMCGF